MSSHVAKDGQLRHRSVISLSSWYVTATTDCMEADDSQKRPCGLRPKRLMQDGERAKARR